MAIIANLPRTIAQREVETVVNLLNWDKEYAEIVETKNSAGPGNIVLIEIGTSTGVTELFCGFGRLGASAESVAAEAAKEARDYLVSEAVAREPLADQLLLPFALTGAGEFTAQKLNRHARTNMDVISSFLAVDFETTQEAQRIRIEAKARV